MCLNIIYVVVYFRYNYKLYRNYYLCQKYKVPVQNGASEGFRYETRCSRPIVRITWVYRKLALILVGFQFNHTHIIFI